MKKTFMGIAAVLAAGVVQAEIMDRQPGFKIGERLTLRPRVSFSYTWDSNATQEKHGDSVSSLIVNPALGAEYIGDTWRLTASAWYRYHWFDHYVRQLNESSYGEDLSWAWANAPANEKGWSLMLSEKFHAISQDDDMSQYSGRGKMRDRREFDIAGVVQRRFNENLHGSVDASYYYLDYDNNHDKYAQLYGWSRLVLGAEAGYAISQWTDVLLAANWQRYDQKNYKNNYAWYANENVMRESSRRYADNSDGLSVMVGLGSYATDRISYRAMVGWSRFNYADGYYTADGWTYNVSGKWQISETWNTMLLATSYYQPSERDFGSAVRVDSISWGLAHQMIKGKLKAVLDLAYRHETHEYTTYDADDYDENIFTGRIGLDYIINRFLAVFGQVEYQKLDTERNRGYYYDWEYDRFRATVGFRLTY